MSIIRDQYNKLQQIYKRKMESLNETLAKEETSLQSKAGKRKLDLEGYSSDLQNLQKRMVFYQNYIGKLKKLVDKDAMAQRETAIRDKNMFGMDQDIILE